MTTIKNPWYRKDGPYSRPFFEYPDAPKFSHRGVLVYKNHAGSWDYVLGDTAITQRAGFSKDKAPTIIDEILDGFAPVADSVADHLRIYGFSPLTYTDYSKAVTEGRME